MITEPTVQNDNSLRTRADNRVSNNHLTSNPFLKKQARPPCPHFLINCHMIRKIIGKRNKIQMRQPAPMYSKRFLPASLAVGWSDAFSMVFPAIKNQTTILTVAIAKFSRVPPTGITGLS